VSSCLMGYVRVTAYLLISVVIRYRISEKSVEVGSVQDMSLQASGEVSIGSARDR